MAIRRWGAPAAVAVVIAAIVVLAVRLAGGSSTPRPTVLHLGSAGAGTAAMSAMSAMSATPANTSSPANPGDPYTLDTSLPDEKPADAPVYRLPESTADDAATVASALGLTGTPTRADGGWVLRIGNNRLAVRDDGSWSYGLDCFSGPEAQEELTVECAYASAGGVAVASPADEAPPPAPTPSVAPGPTESTARATAEHVMSALGFSDAEIVVNAGDPTAYVQATPHIDGQLAVGWITWLAVKADGSIDNGNGWATAPRSDASYPLISAQAAFDLLKQQPRPMMDMCMLRPDGKPGCAEAPPTEITGATLGLTIDYDADKPVLVPAWLFAVKDQTEPLAQVAIDPAYLAQPSPEPVPVGKGGGTGGSTGGGTIEPPMPAEPPSQP